MTTPLLRVAALVLGSLAMPAPAAARTAVDLECVASGTGPQLDCTVRLRAAAGEPLTGATVTLGASMPSMPMAHHVHATPAQPTGAPGEYRGRLALEMSGAWTVQVDIAGPVRDRVARTLQVDDCEGSGRCPAIPIAGARPSAKP